MKISYQWLKDYLDLSVPADELAEKIERTAVEVDAVIKPSAGMKKVVVGHVDSIAEHPDSDHLHVCQVDVGEAEDLQIVCGAPNVDAGQNVIVALPNSWIGNHTKIKKSKMRGVVSQGMICALQEIGFDEKVAPKKYADGIYVLPADAKPGDSVFDYLGMNDEIIDMSVTPNRGDMLSMNGTAWEVGAIYDQQPKLPTVDLQETAATKTADQVQIDVAEPTDVPIYKMRIVNNVKIQPSPMWLQIRLWNAGVRPINNIVDITNYILIQYGQPLHAFDYDKLQAGHLNVRYAHEGEKLTTLDSEERTFKATDLVICNEDRPVALAGTMGGLDTEITDDTTTVAVEAAVFNSSRIRKTARFHNLHSAASMRFERGIDQSNVQQALDAAAAMMAELGEGAVSQGTVAGSDTKVEPAVVKITLSRINHVLGTDLDVAAVSDIFRRLAFPTTVAGEEYTVTIPPRRWDIHIPEDLIEEVARLYGYDQLPSTLPVAPITVGKLNAKQRLIRASRQLMEASGLTQAISYALTTESKATDFTLEDGEVTKLALPMSSERTTLRENLVSGLLDDLAYNLARKQENVALYEQGRVFIGAQDADRPAEIEHLAGAITGQLVPKGWDNANQPVDFYQIKGIVENYLKDLSLANPVRFVAAQDRPQMHPGRTADIYVGDQLVGFVGQVHPTTAKAYKVNETLVFELNLQALLDAPKQVQQSETISKFPSITRDIALLVDQNVTNADLLATIKAKGGAYLADVQLFDLYTGSHLPAGKKSLAYQLTYTDPEKTLVDDEVTAAFDKVVAALQTEHNAEIR